MSLRRERLKKWAHLENMLYETPDKLRGPQTAKASSRLGLPQNTIFKFMRNNKLSDNVRSLNTLQLPTTPDKEKSITKFNFDSDSRGTGSRNQIDVILHNKAPESYNSLNSIDDELLEPMSSELKKTVPKQSNFKKESLQIADQPHSLQTVVITSRNTKKKFNLKQVPHSMTQLERQYKNSDPICGIDEEQFSILFKKKCEVDYFCLHLISKWNRIWKSMVMLKLKRNSSVISVKNL